MELDADSLERIVPDGLVAGDTTGEQTLRLGLERYEFASRFLRPGRVLDIACGVGYGTRVLGERCRDAEVLGVDLSEAAIAYAEKRYALPHLHFRAADAMRFEDPRGFETIVSIETIEHLPDPVRFIERIVRLLKPGGILVGSVPVTPSVDANPHHLHDFTPRGFRKLFLRHGLVELEALHQDQPFGLFSVLARREARMSQVRPNLPAYYASHPGSALRRVWSTLRHGFKNIYLTIAWRAPA